MLVAGHRLDPRRRHVGRERRPEQERVDVQVDAETARPEERHGDQGYRDDAAEVVGAELQDALARLRRERGDEDERADLRIAQRGVGDHRAAVGVSDEDDRPGDLVDDVADRGGIAREAAQRVVGHDDGIAAGAQAPGHITPARGAVPRPVHDDDRRLRPRTFLAFASAGDGNPAMPSATSTKRIVPRTATIVPEAERRKGFPGGSADAGLSRRAGRPPRRARSPVRRSRPRRARAPRPCGGRAGRRACRRAARRRSGRPPARPRRPRRGASPCAVAEAHGRRARRQQRHLAGRDRQAEDRARVQRELAPHLGRHRDHAGVVRARADLAEQDLVAAHEQLDAEDARCRRAPSVTAARIACDALDLRRASSRAAASSRGSRRRPGRWPIGSQNDRPAGRAHRQHRDLAVELDEVLDDHAARAGAARRSARSATRFSRSAALAHDRLALARGRS